MLYVGKLILKHHSETWTFSIAQQPIGVHYAFALKRIQARRFIRMKLDIAILHTARQAGRQAGTNTHAHIYTHK